MMKSLKELTDQVVKGGSVPDPKVIKVEAQVRTGVMFPLPDWIDAPKEIPVSLSDKRQD